MNLINHIGKYKALILTIGMIAGLGLIAQPVFKAYAYTKVACEVTKDAESDQQESSKTENPDQTQISSFNAVAPTAQIHLLPLDFIVQNQSSIEAPVENALAKVVVRLPEKLLKVLFNIIIAPNAP